MKTRKITESQLREMIKESLEESIVEIGEDDERSKLSRLGSKRTPEQNRKYKQLLESKLRRLHEDLGQQQVPGSATAEEGAMLKGEKRIVEVDDILQKFRARLGQLTKLEAEIKAGNEDSKAKLTTPDGKKFANLLGANSKLQDLFGKLDNPSEIVDVIMAILEDVIKIQHESEQAKP